ncbi:hypothetical protein HNR46_003665 [Haloferula luteola]|uniref:Uncharacterized protein n=1 Tax=Haloferula luteola TaxID=595692 RepID=A0A840VFL5_9BACT|nr:hypothetical protein [Haloferula luteola]
MREAHTDLEQLSNNVQGGEVGGYQYVAALMLSLWHMMGTRLVNLPPPSFVIVQGRPGFQPGRDWLWAVLREFRRSLSRDCVRFLRKRAIARKFLHLRASSIRNDLKQGWVDDSTRDAILRVSPEVQLQRFWALRDVQLGVAPSPSGISTLWTGSDQHVQMLKSLMAEGCFEGKPVATRHLFKAGISVPISVVGGVSRPAWAAHLAKGAFGDGRRMLGIGIGDFMHPPHLDCRMSTSLETSIRILSTSPERFKVPFRTDGCSLNYARVVQRSMPMLHPDYLDSLISAMRGVRLVSKIITRFTVSGKGPPEGLDERLGDAACRGLALGTLALLPEAWMASSEREENELGRILKAVSQSGSIRRRGILQKVQPMTSAKRDEYLQVLQQLRMVKVDGLWVKSVSSEEWIPQIPDIFRLP